mmetsp:Transcript_13553/g.49301  ORF Transcript_13553/g.49301 Transcript_13553/m.49301 type:complete len:264 (-) Transcript_13553:116-907(-)
MVADKSSPCWVINPDTHRAVVVGGTAYMGLKKKGVNVDALQRHYGTKPEGGTPSRTPKKKGTVPAVRPILPSSPIGYALPLQTATYVQPRLEPQVHISVPKTSSLPPKQPEPAKLFKARVPEAKAPVSSPAAKPASPAAKTAAKTASPSPSKSAPKSSGAKASRAAPAPSSRPSTSQAARAPQGDTARFLKSIAPFLTAFTALGCPQLAKFHSHWAIKSEYYTFLYLFVLVLQGHGQFNLMRTLTTVVLVFAVVKGCENYLAL